MLPTQCLCTKLRRAARSVSRFYDEALADTGLKVAQFSCCGTCGAWTY